MPRFYRNSRALLRIFFVLVITAGFAGWRYALNNWQIEPESIALPTLAEGADWIEITATLLEAGVRIFLGALGG